MVLIIRKPLVEGDIRRDIKVSTVDDLRSFISAVKHGHFVTTSNKRDIAALLANENEEISKQSLELIDQEFTCGICLSLVKQARLLMCRHFFCRECILTWKKSKTFCTTTCPICRLWFHSIFMTRFSQADSIFELVIKYSKIYQDEKLEEANQIVRTVLDRFPFDHVFDENGQPIVDMFVGRIHVVRESDNGNMVYRIQNPDECLRLT